jgi:predicted kinase
MDDREVGRVPRLILLNGPPGIGKSTPAKRFISEHRFAFCLDLDGLSRLIGQGGEDLDRTHELARDLCVAMARTHLANGYDVIVPQFLARPVFIQRLKAVALESGADWRELVLLDADGAEEQRFEQRADDPLWADHHREAAGHIEAAGG